MLTLLCHLVQRGMRDVEYEISGARISSLPMGEAAVVRAKLDPSPGMNKVLVLPWPVEDTELQNACSYKWLC